MPHQPLGSFHDMWLVGNRRSDTLRSVITSLRLGLWLVGNRRSDTLKKGGGTVKPPAPRFTRQKFTCRKCGQNAWAKPGAKLMCGICKRALKPLGLV